ncbi:MAG TPA: hypothetical protein O0X64_00865, partial [Methanocorpusculum sp.]|nr:hypothetical protein [Methanocorpusculum sp.]
IHPRALVPAMQKNIPVRDKNTFNPEHPGTVVIRKPHADKRIVKAVSLIQNSCLVKVSGSLMTGKPGVVGRNIHNTSGSRCQRNANITGIRSKRFLCCQTSRWDKSSTGNSRRVPS